MEYSDFFTSQTAFHYFMGFCIADGHMSMNSRNRGKIQIELKESDADILIKLQKSILVNSKISQRTRKSNFSKKFSSKTLTIYDLNFRNFVLKSGLPYGSKVNVKIPKDLLQDKDFWRGIIDGDGSIGITKDKKCFVSLVTKSEDVRNNYCNLLFKLTGNKKNINRNKRDNVYNIVSLCEDAQDIIRFLDYSDLYLNRKAKSAKNVLRWKRPKTILKKSFQVKKWTKEEDSFILNHTISESIARLKRTKQSVKSRLWRIS